MSSVSRKQRLSRNMLRGHRCNCQVLMMSSRTSVCDARKQCRSVKRFSGRRPQTRGVLM